MKTYPKFITIGEHKVPLPALPKRKEDILFINEKRENCYWKRQEFPQIFYDYNYHTKTYQPATIYNEDEVLISLSVEDSKLLHQLQEQEIRRRIYGVHAKIDDQIMWIAPDYYHNLQWCEMKDLPEKFGRFRWIQNDVMILWWAVRTLWKEWCAGLIIPKAKKTGITQIAAGAFLNELTTNSGFEMGAASKEYDHVRDVFMAYLFHAYDNMPYILRPEAKKRNFTELILGTPTKRIGSHKQISSNEKMFNLNSRINGYKTKSNCFDGPVLKRGFIDELPKWWESSKVHPDSVLTKNIEAVKLQEKINGHLLIGSYMPEIDDAGFHEFAEYIKRSKLKTVNALTGRTSSSLIMFAMTAVESYETCFDKFGRCDQRKAYQLVTAELQTKPKLGDQMAFRRQYPRDENDMFDSGGRGTTYDNIRLARYHREVEEMIENGASPFKYARVRWANSDWEDGSVLRPVGKFCNVELKEITDQEMLDGKRDHFEVRVHYTGPFSDLEPYFNQVFQRNNRHEEDDAYCPLPESDAVPMVASWDPVEYALKREIVDASTNAGFFGWLFDSNLNQKFKQPITRRPLLEYIFRHEDPDDDYENLVKLILLTGCRILVEGNKRWVYTRLLKDGLHHFLLYKNAEGAIVPYVHGVDEIKPVNATPQTINDYVRATKRMWREPKSEGELDYMQLSRSPLMYIQAMNFDPTDTRPFDVMVAYSWYCVAQESYGLFLSEQEDNDGFYSAEAFALAMNNLLHN